jgi:hypothetical protein
MNRTSTRPPAAGRRPARWLPAPLRPAAAARAGLFGYTESLAVPYAETSLVVEFTGAAVLAAAAAIVLVPLLRRRS